ncbi:MAG: Holliday junction branch migration protein RuvA [Phycisphaerae bacterium]
MIVRIAGELTDILDESIVVDRDGMAYEILVPPCELSELIAARGERVTLHTQQYLEGSAAGGNLTPRLVGFLHAEERAFFQQFITVKGMGVRKGLRALATPVAQIASAIESGESAALTRLPGIGRRMAEQIIAQLRGKVAAHALAAEEVSEPARQAFSEQQRDAIEIIVAWGDSRHDAQRWVARAGSLHDDLGGPEDWVRAAYRIKSGAEA